MNTVECPHCGQKFDNELRAGSPETYHIVMQGEGGKIITVPAHNCGCSEGRRGGEGKTALATGYTALGGREA